MTLLQSEINTTISDDINNNGVVDTGDTTRVEITKAPIDNYVYSFDGVDSQISFGNVADVAGDTLAVSFWAKRPTAIAGNKYVVSKTNNAGTQGYAVNFEGINLRFFAGIGGVIKVLKIPYPQDGAFHHYTARYDGSQLSIFIDGVKYSATTAVTGNITTTTGVLNVGNFSTSSARFTGQLSDVRIFDSLITDQQIQDLYNRQYTDGGDLLRVMLQETAGTTAYDASGNGNHGTLVGGVAHTVDNTVGINPLNYDGYGIAIYQTGDDTNASVTFPSEAKNSDITVQYDINTTDTVFTLLGSSDASGWYNFLGQNLTSAATGGSSGGPNLYVDDVLVTGTTRVDVLNAISGKGWVTVRMENIDATPSGTSIVTSYTSGVYRSTSQMKNFKVDVGSTGTWDYESTLGDDNGFTNAGTTEVFLPANAQTPTEDVLGGDLMVDGFNPTVDFSISPLNGTGVSAVAMIPDVNAGNWYAEYVADGNQVDGDYFGKLTESGITVSDDGSVEVVAEITTTDIFLTYDTVNEDRPIGTVIGQFSADDSTSTYTLVSGVGDTDNTSFNISSGNNLILNTSLDYNTKASYSIRVKAGNSNYEEQFIINIKKTIMGNQLQFYGQLADTGKTIIAKVYNSSGTQVGADITCVEDAGSLAIYRGDMPSAPLGKYGVRFFDGATLVGNIFIEWDGDREEYLTTILAKDWARQSAANTQI